MLTAKPFNQNNYYPFGMVMHDRSWVNSDYRFGFNGCEKDDDLKGTGNSIAADFREYDPRIGRWISRDPIVKAWESPYVGFADNPIYYSDPSGLDPNSCDDDNSVAGPNDGCDEGDGDNGGLFYKGGSSESLFKLPEVKITPDDGCDQSVPSDDQSVPSGDQSVATPKDNLTYKITPPRPDIPISADISAIRRFFWRMEHFSLGHAKMGGGGAEFTTTDKKPSGVRPMSTNGIVVKINFDNLEMFTDLVNPGGIGLEPGSRPSQEDLIFGQEGTPDEPVLHTTNVEKNISNVKATQEKVMNEVILNFQDMEEAGITWTYPKPYFEGDPLQHWYKGKKVSYEQAVDIVMRYKISKGNTAPKVHFDSFKK